MTHDQYLEAYLALTSASLTEIALLHGRESWAEATTAVTQLRAQQDALWETFRASAGQLVNP